MPLKLVRWLSIKEIAALWSPEIDIPASIIERELRLALINLPRIEAGEGLIEVFPENDLPPTDSIMTQDQIYAFCEKEGHWPRPIFWFGEQQRGPSFVGRPSIMSAIAQQLDTFAKSGQLNETLAGQARELQQWAQDVFPKHQTPKAKTIENGIRLRFKGLQQNAKGIK